MNRNEAIAIITSQLASLDDESVQTVADMVQSLSNDNVLPRELTPRELALIEQSKEDFRLGRTLGPDEYRAEMAAFMAGLKAKYPTPRGRCETCAG